MINFPFTNYPYLIKLLALGYWKALKYSFLSYPTVSYLMRKCISDNAKYSFSPFKGKREYTFDNGIDWKHFPFWHTHLTFMSILFASIPRQHVSQIILKNKFFRFLQTTSLTMMIKMTMTMTKIHIYILMMNPYANKSADGCRKGRKQI